jgi:hypothetical protein
MREILIDAIQGLAPQEQNHHGRPLECAGSSGGKNLKAARSAGSFSSFL